VVIEKALIMSILKLTKNGPASPESINKDAKLPFDVASELLRKFQTDGMVYLCGDNVGADTGSRLKLAVRAVALGADIERVSDFLRWQEFEDIAAIALERNGYFVAKNVRFKHAGRRWELDIVGCRKPLVLCVDCKHWRHGVKPSALRKIAEAQVERARALADVLPSVTLKVECAKWNKAKFAPVILSLIPSSFKFYNNVPVVPVLQLQDFLIQLPLHVESLKYFVKEFNHL